MNTRHCSNDPCEAEAVKVTVTDALLCWTCAEAYQWGQASPDNPLKELDNDSWKSVKNSPYLKGMTF